MTTSIQILVTLSFEFAEIRRAPMQPVSAVKAKLFFCDLLK